MKLSQAATILNGKLIGEDVEFTSINTDTRTTTPGDLYIARRGEALDGHDYIQAAKDKKAAAALVDHSVAIDLPQLQVADTTKALGQLAAYHRSLFKIPVVGVTGSCGKTTVKNLLGSIFKQCGNVLFNESSFNNHVGLPLTLWQLNSKHQYAVVEIGTNHVGEIANLAAIAKPTVAIITNAAPAHLEGLGTVEGVAREKGAIYESLSKDGIAIINADDQFADYWKSLVPGRKVFTFSMHNSNADFYARDIQMARNGKARFHLVTPTGETLIHLPIMGEHNVGNALAAAAATYAVGIPLAAIHAGLENAMPEKKRLNEYHTPEGAFLIDDSYNANPLSVKAAINLLALHNGQRVLVLGDMLELGENAKTYHQTLGEQARALGIEKLFAYGKLSAATASGFGKDALHFTDQQQLIAVLKPQLTKDMVLLVKGSKSMKMGNVVKALLDN
jgi:UDP-N-acetylmuramoyl-tripeptide--D-alanyl-D-alanine ligase